MTSVSLSDMPLQKNIQYIYYVHINIIQKVLMMFWLFGYREKLLFDENKSEIFNESAKLLFITSHLFIMIILSCVGKKIFILTVLLCDVLLCSFVRRVLCLRDFLLFSSACL